VNHLKAEDADQSKIMEYSTHLQNNPNISLSERRKLAAQYTREPVFFSWDIPKTREGFYHYKAGALAATKRAKEYAPYADLLWVETGTPNLKTAAAFANEIRKAYPGKKLVYNLSPSFNWMAQGFNEASLRSFIWDLAKHGLVIIIIGFEGGGEIILLNLRLPFLVSSCNSYLSLVFTLQRPSPLNWHDHFGPKEC
jgi:isocitrate lyase